MIAAIPPLLILVVLCLVFILFYGNRSSRRPSFYGAWITVFGAAAVVLLICLIFSR